MTPKEVSFIYIIDIYLVEFYRQNTKKTCHENQEENHIRIYGGTTYI